MKRVIPHTLFTDYDINLFRSGNHHKLYEKFGAHEITINGKKGIYCAVYAPAAYKVQVIGNFNFWSGVEHNLSVRWDHSGIWEGFVPDLKKGELYKFKIYSNLDSRIREQSDPYGFYFEQAPKTSSIAWDTGYKWKDKAWMNKRENANPYKQTLSIYEVHLGSWKKNLEENRSLHYKELADELVTYVEDMGYTHVEFLPLTEHPYYPSWGYLTTGYFAPTSRFGSPQDFMALVDALHQNEIGVILDWVPAHFPSDDSFLADFDGSNVYEHPNPKRGYHPDWKSLIFNYERPEIRSFLISSARFWLDKYHIDGLRVDAVASMLYLDYSREEGEWEPNQYGGRENLAAIDFLKALNTSCYGAHPGIVMIAEESTAFTGVSKSVDSGGLGFGFKWMMGWMNDSLRYLERETIHRKQHHNEISFSMAYFYSESFVLPLSHDEVVHGKSSVVYKMPGDEWQRFANVRLLYSFMFSHPGHKLLFMGMDIGQTEEWEVNDQVHWALLKYKFHSGVQELVKDLNHLLRTESALSHYNFEPHGFEWIDHSDAQNSTLAYLRKSDKDTILVACNFTPRLLEGYRIGVPYDGEWKEVLNSDAKKYGGSSIINKKIIKSANESSHGRPYSVDIVLPPLGVAIFKFSRS